MADKVRTDKPLDFFCDRCAAMKTSRLRWQYRYGLTLCNGCHGYVVRFGSEVFHG